MLTGALGWALLWGLGVARAPVRDAPTLVTFDVPPRPVAAVRVEPERARAAPRAAGRAAPPNLRATPAEIVAPVPVRPPLEPPPLVTAPVAGPGAAPRAGAAEMAGPGTGAGGMGDGRGSGQGGAGDGGGGGDETPPRRIRGGLRDSDYPEAAAEAGVGGVVGVRYLVGIDGRVPECVVTRTSGNAALDAATCRLIRERLRFRPSRDSAGRAVPAWIVENHEWVVQRVPADPSAPPPPRRRRFRIF
ncbi:energy transducer TonB [Sphingomonas sp. CJ20]